MKLQMIAVRALVAYVYLLFIIRASGKRTISQASPLDFVVALILGDMIDDLLWAEVSAAKFAVGTGTVVLAHIITSLGSFHSDVMRRLVHGMPQVIVVNGIPLPSGTRSVRASSLDYHYLLRGLGIEDAREVRRVQVEVSGKPSLQKQPWAKEAQKKDVETHRQGQEERP